MIQTNPEQLGPVQIFVPVKFLANSYAAIPFHHQESAQQAAERAAALAEQMNPTPGPLFDPETDMPACPIWLYRYDETEAERKQKTELAGGVARVFQCLAGN